MIFILASWGSEAYNKQALLAAKSILARSDSARIIVFASRPQLFVDKRITVIPITKFDMKDWQGPLNFFFRRKIHILKKALLNLSDSDAICYIDSDFYCYSLPEEFRTDCERVLMFNREGRIGCNFHPNLYNFLTSNKELLADNCYSDLVGLEMYNAGLIYLPKGLYRFRALEEVLQLTDFLCLRFPRQMTWLEQAAFSHVLPKYSELGTVSKGFVHYWDLNSEIGCLINKKSVDDIIKIAKSERLFENLYSEARSIVKTFANRRRLFLKKQKKSIVTRVDLLKYFLT